MRRARLDVVKEEIIQFFDTQSRRVFTIAQLNELLISQWDVWKLPKSTTLGGFINFLINQKKLWEQRFNFNFCPVTLFFWGEVTTHEVAMSLRPHGYLSHLSAMRFHTLLADNKARTIYVNDEQGPKPRSAGGLEQGRIDWAFRRRPKVSNNKITVGESVFYLLSGKHTGRLGVIEQELPGLPVPIRVTCLERTLIDAVVRSAYSGSVHGVLEAYRRASDRVNIEYLADLLQQLDYVYPFHQAIGFYLEHSEAYDRTAIERFKALPQEFDFYLDYEMGEVKFSEDWRLYYPAYLS
jgi:hypothetical protein